jgi:phosphonate transport system permease protein
MITAIRKRRSNRISIRQFNKSNAAINVTIAVLVMITVYCFMTIDTNNTDILKASVQVANDLGRMFFLPQSSHLAFFQALYSVIVTLGLGFLTTVIGAVIALVFGFFAAQNLTNPSVSNVIKGFVALIRAIPTVLWVLIFAIGAGLGSVAAVVGMTFHTVGYLIKAYSEVFEEIDFGIIEALKASGANWLHIIFQAVIPSSMSLILTWTFIRFEINFTTSVAMGAAAAAGGIGFDLFQASSFYFNINEVGFITYMILAVAIVLEFTANRLKR